MEITVPTDSLDAVVDMWVDLATDQRQHGSHLRPAENRTAIRESMVRHRVDGSVYVAREDDQLLGFVTFTVQQPTYVEDVTRGIVENLYVRPTERDRGVGRALLDAAEEALATRDVDVVSLEVLAANESGQRFYRRSGYESIRLTLEKPLGNTTAGRD